MTVYNVSSLPPDSAANVYDCRKEADMNKKGITILYSRLSVDDEREGNSGSIENQKMLLEAYADKNGLTPHIHVFDDGYSGTGWDRPGWLKIMEEVEAGHVQNIVCKNLDRLGRDYIRVGLLLERFQESKVRFIAVEDGIDTERGVDDLTPFRAIFAEWYARDCSNKIRAIFRAKEQEGKHVSPAVPYGYLRDKEDKQIEENHPAVPEMRYAAEPTDGIAFLQRLRGKNDIPSVSAGAWRP